MAGGWEDPPTIAVDSRLWVALEGPDVLWLGKLAHELGQIGIRARRATDEDQSASGKHPTIVVECGYPEMGERGPGEVAPLESDPMIWFPGKDGTMVSLRGDRHLGVLAMEIARFVKQLEDTDDDTVQDDLLQERIREAQQRANAPKPQPAPSFATPPRDAARPGSTPAAGPPSKPGASPALLVAAAVALLAVVALAVIAATTLG